MAAMQQQMAQMQQQMAQMQGELESRKEYEALLQRQLKGERI